MATTTMKRQQQQKATGQWSSIFPNEQSTHQQSALFVKKLLAVAISNITYLRTIFPEQAFGDRCLEDLSLKILRDDSSCPGACQVIQWVKGCFEALDKKYLRMIVIGIYDDASDLNNVVETYSFKFDYKDNQSLKIFRNDDEVVSAFSNADTKRATIKLLRTIVILTQTLKPLPDDALMTMKLFYYDDVTPPDYEPEGFKATQSDEDLQFKGESVGIKVGDVATAFHSVKLRIRTSGSQFEMVEEAQSQQSTLAPVKTSETVVEGAKVKAAEPSSSDQAEMNMSVDEPSSNMAEEEEEENVRCPCGVNENDGLMIWCDGCEVWQHALCYGFLADSKLPDTHFCEQCCSSTDSGPRQCTDPHLLTLDPVALQATCLWRRALVASSEFTRILPAQFSKRLGVEVTVAQGLISRLDKEGYMKTSLKGKRLGKVVDKEKVVNEGISKYFNKEAAKKKQAKTTARMSTGGRTPRKQAITRSIQQDPSPAQQSNIIEEVTQQTSALGISSRRKPNKPVIPEHLLEEGVRRSPRLRKRARSTVDEDAEFEISMSQEQGTRANKKRKASIASRSILV